MSGYLTTAAVKVVPSAAAALSLTAGGAGAYGSWVEAIASAAADLTLAGVVPTVFGAGDVQVGVGGAGSEVAIATVKIGGSSTGFTTFVTFPVPVITKILSGNRVALRCRGTNTTASILYYQGYDGNIGTATVPSVVPDTAAMVSITPSGTAWNNSSWVQITAGLSNVGAFYALSHTVQSAGDYEWDIGTGGAGSETVVATIASHNSTGGWHFHKLPALLTIAASTRIAVRVRKTGTNTTAITAALSYYDLLDPSTLVSTFNALLIAP
jgi:hypothetical protein